MRILCNALVFHSHASRSPHHLPLYFTPWYSLFHHMSIVCSAQKKKYFGTQKNIFYCTSFRRSISNTWTSKDGKCWQIFPFRTMQNLTRSLFPQNFFSQKCSALSKLISDMVNKKKLVTSSPFRQFAAKFHSRGCKLSTPCHWDTIAHTCEHIQTIICVVEKYPLAIKSDFDLLWVE